MEGIKEINYMLYSICMYKTQSACIYDCRNTTCTEFTGFVGLYVHHVNGDKGKARVFKMLLLSVHLDRNSMQYIFSQLQEFAEIKICKKQNKIEVLSLREKKRVIFNDEFVFTADHEVVCLQRSQQQMKSVMETEREPDTDCINMHSMLFLFIPKSVIQKRFSSCSFDLPNRAISYPFSFFTKLMS